MPGKGTQLQIDDHADGFVLVGELDGQTAPELESRLHERLDSTAEIRLDVRGVGFMDSSGLRVVLAAADRARRAGGDLVLVEPTSTVLRLLELSELHDHFTLESTTDQD